ncbi:MAG: fumarylacetoacetate hydrolase family protein [Chloroflexi bacterium]|nr:fumarylacetoacetate hydrolase family protein [Chloroflexota bacterium]
MRPSQARFLDPHPWPDTLTGLLALGDTGMAAARRMQTFLLRFLEQSDQALLAGAGYRLSEVELRAPIPRPRLCFGLVDNKPKRNVLARPLLHIYPQGHQRPQGAIVGPGQPIVITTEMRNFFWNPELGIVIGKAGRDISIDDAMAHVAGYTVVLDLAHDLYLEQMKAQAPGELDFFEAATGSWLGKKSDTFCPMGPYLVTADEVGNPYDLLIYTRQSGWQRDRSHTSAMLVGIEHTIHYLSSFMTLQVGDVIHMATMGVDGLPYSPEMTFGPEDYLEGEIERVGTLRVPVVMGAKHDWRQTDDPGRSLHAAPPVRDMFQAGTTQLLEPADWSLADARHVWTLYGNYAEVETAEGLGVRPLPRIINSPGSVLGPSDQPLHIPERATALQFGVELAFVIGRLAHRIPSSEADDYILGYVVLAVMHDQSHQLPPQCHATKQERYVPTTYARWVDGSNVASPLPTRFHSADFRDRDMHLTLHGYDTLTGSTDEYVAAPAETLAFLSQEITLLPGDVVTLGRTHHLLSVAADQPLSAETMLGAEIEGVGQVVCSIIDTRKVGK